MTTIEIIALVLCVGVVAALSATLISMHNKIKNAMLHLEKIDEKDFSMYRDGTQSISLKTILNAVNNARTETQQCLENVEKLRNEFITIDEEISKKFEELNKAIELQNESYSAMVETLKTVVELIKIENDGK